MDQQVLPQREDICRRTLEAYQSLPEQLILNSWAVTCMVTTVGFLQTMLLMKNHSTQSNGSTIVVTSYNLTHYYSRCSLAC